jgi:hypothetical protein
MEMRDISLSVREKGVYVDAVERIGADGIHHRIAFQMMYVLELSMASPTYIM